MRSRSITSTVLGTSEIARSVRVAVTTTRSNSVASAVADAAAVVGSVCGAGDGPAARAMPGNARHSASDSGLGRMDGLVEWKTFGVLASGVGPVAGGPGERTGRGRCGPSTEGLLGEDELVVARVAQAIALAAVADQQFALALEQADAVDLDGFGAGGALARVVLGGVGRAVCVVRVDDKHRSAPSIGVIDVNDSHLPVKHRCVRPRPDPPWSPRPAPSPRHRPAPAPPAPAGS